MAPQEKLKQSEANRREKAKSGLQLPVGLGQALELSGTLCKKSCTSFSLSSPSEERLYTAKIEPTETFARMFEKPSSGSMTHTYGDVVELLFCTRDRPQELRIRNVSEKHADDL